MRITAAAGAAPVIGGPAAGVPSPSWKPLVEESGGGISALRVFVENLARFRGSYINVEWVGTNSGVRSESFHIDTAKIYLENLK